MATSTAARSLARVAKLCLALPEVTREDQGDHAGFRVRGKVFAYFLDNHHGDGIVSVCFKMSAGENTELVRLASNRFYLPAYLGSRGWAGMRLDVAAVDWEEVESFLIESYRLAAPKRLAVQVDR